MNKINKHFIVLTLLFLVLIIATLIVDHFYSLQRGTVYADLFNKNKWNTIEKGMSMEHVQELIGPPLDYVVRWGTFSGEENYQRLLWSMPKSGQGYFRCIWFDNGKVIRKMTWADD